jgi:hypothetical protein
MNRSKLWVTSAMALILSSCASLPDLSGEVTNSLDVNEKWQMANSEPFSIENGWLETLSNKDLSQYVDEVLQSNPNYNEFYSSTGSISSGGPI